MKSIEEKAEEYAKKKIKGYNDYFLQPQFSNAQTDFIAGYKAAQEWISVDDELPETEMWINVKSELSGISPFYKSMFYVIENKTALKLNYTHWKPIE